MKNEKLLGRWSSAKVAKTWSEGITVLIRRLDRTTKQNQGIELCSYFRPDWVENESGYGIVKSKFKKVTDII